MAIFAQIHDTAISAFRCARPAHIATMQNHPVMRVQFEFIRNEFMQLVFYFQHSFAWSQRGAVCHPEDMGIHRDHRLAKSSVEQYIGGFAPHTGQRFQFGACPGYCAAMFLQQHFTGLDDMSGFGTVQTDTLHMVTQFFFAQI